MTRGRARAVTVSPPGWVVRASVRGVLVRVGVLFVTLGALAVTPHAILGFSLLAMLWFIKRPSDRLDAVVYVVFLGLVNGGMVHRLELTYYVLLTKALFLGLLGAGVARAWEHLPVVLGRFPGFGILFGYMAWACVVAAVQPESAHISLLKIVQYTWVMVGLLGLAVSTSRASPTVENAVAWFVFVWVGSVAVVGLTPFGRTGDMSVLLATGRESTMVRGIFDHSQTLGVALGVSVPMLCSLYVVGLFDRRTFLLTAGPSALLLVATSSRGGVLTAILGFLALVFVSVFSRRASRGSTRARRLAKGAVGVLVLAAGLFFFTESAASAVAHFLAKGGSVDEGLIAERNFSGRDVIIRRSFEKFRERPIAGYGFQVEDTPEFRERATLFRASVEKSFVFTMVLEETGLVGAALFLLMIAWILYDCLIRQNVVVFTVFSAFIAANFSEAIFFSPGAVGGLVMALLAIAVRIDLVRPRAAGASGYEKGAA